jgi:hypothetical protein
MKGGKIFILYAKIHRRVQNWLTTALAADTVFSPRYLCDVETALNWVEDPRFDPENCYLPNDELARFTKIPAGPFLMGSAAEDAEAFREELPDYLRDVVESIMRMRIIKIYCPYTDG